MQHRLARDCLAPGPLLKAGPEESVRDAAIAMATHRARAVLVCRDDTLIGIVSESDLVSRVMALGRPLDTSLLEVMTANPDIVAGDAPIARVLRQMRELDCHHLPVAEAGRLVGILACHDLAFAEAAAGAAPAPDKQLAAS